MTTKLPYNENVALGGIIDNTFDKGFNVEDFFGLLIGLAVAVFYIACSWRIFEKAGKPGWLSIIPIVSTFMLVEIAGKEWWWFVLLLIPVVNFFAAIIILHGLSENFGHGVGFTLGLLFLSFIFFPILAFGGSQYEGKRKRKVNYA